VKIIAQELNADTGLYEDRTTFGNCLALRAGPRTYHIEALADGSLRIQNMERGALAVLPVVNNTIIVKPMDRT
jgi:hypothetical protein